MTNTDTMIISGISDGSGTSVEGPGVAEYGAAVSGASAMNVPPLEGSPFHHCAPNMNAPLFMNPAGGHCHGGQM